MKHSIARVLSLLAAAGLAACADAAAPVNPPAPAAASFSASSGDELDGRYLVAFNRGVPADFADRVAALGGTVVFAHDGAGVGALGASRTVGTVRVPGAVGTVGHGPIGTLVGAWST